MKRSRKKRKISIVQICLLIILILSIVGGIKLYTTYSVSKVDGVSMAPTIDDGDVLLINKQKTPSDQDIIILDVSDMHLANEEIVKRYYAEYSTDGYYVLGDNSDVSLDSRELGELDQSRFRGTVVKNLTKDGNVFEKMYAKIVNYIMS